MHTDKFDFFSISLSKPQYEVTLGGDTYVHSRLSESEFGSLWVITNKSDNYVTGYEVIQNVRNEYADGTVRFEYPSAHLQPSHYYETLDHALEQYCNLIEHFENDIVKIDFDSK